MFARKRTSATGYVPRTSAIRVFVHVSSFEELLKSSRHRPPTYLTTLQETCHDFKSPLTGSYTPKTCDSYRSNATVPWFCRVMSCHVMHLTIRHVNLVPSWEDKRGWLVPDDRKQYIYIYVCIISGVGYVSKTALGYKLCHQTTPTFVATHSRKASSTGSYPITYIHLSRLRIKGEGRRGEGDHLIHNRCNHLITSLSMATFSSSSSAS